MPELTKRERDLVLEAVWQRYERLTDRVRMVEPVLDVPGYLKDALDECNGLIKKLCEMEGKDG